MSEYPWLWNFRVRDQVLKALPGLIGHLTERDKRNLLRAILDGPPSANGELPEEDSKQLMLQAERDMHDRLECASEAMGAGFSKEAQVVLDELKVKHPNRAVGPQHREPSSAREVGAFGDLDASRACEEYGGLSLAGLVEALTDDWTERRSLNWDGYGLLRMSRKLSSYHHALAANQPSARGLSRWACSFRSSEINERSACVLLELLVRTDETVLSETAGDFTSFIHDLSRHVSLKSLDQFLRIWDLAFESAQLSVAGRVADSRADKVSEAINHPLGHLCLVLLELGRRGNPEEESGILQELKMRLEALLGLEPPHSYPPLTVAATRACLLYWVEPSWVRETLIPSMSWDDSERASCTWQGFLSGAQITTKFYEAVSGRFKDACRYYGKLDRWGESLAGMLVSLAIDAHLVPPDESKRYLGALPPKGRARMAWILAKRLRDAGKKTESLWSEDIGPWLTDGWPDEARDLRDSDVSQRLAWIATNAGGEFPAAVAVTVPRIGPCEDAMLVLSDLTVNRLSSLYPKDTVELLNAIAPDQLPEWGFDSLKTVLDAVSKADDRLKSDSNFKRLRRISMAAGQ